MDPRIRALWAEHEAAPYPLPHDGTTPDEIEGVDLDLLDGGVAGCVVTFLQNRGRLDAWRTAILGRCYRDAEVAVRGLGGEARAYFARLRDVAGLVLEAVQDDAKRRQRD